MTDRGRRCHAWRRAVPVLAWTLATLLASAAGAQEILSDSDEVEEEAVPLVVPYGFYTDTLGFGIGLAGGLSGYPDPVASIGGTVFGTTESAHLAALRVSFLPLAERLYLRSTVFHGRYPDLRIYEDGNVAFPNERAGANDSSPENYREDRGRDLSLDLELLFVTPWGWRHDEPVPTFRLVDGQPEETSIRHPRWRPWTSGDTRIGLEFFYRRMQLEVPDDPKIATNGLRLEIERDNRDFPPNPNRGSRQLFRVSRDFGWLDSRDSWSFWEVELSRYLRLVPRGKVLRQTVLALNLWTGTSPTWSERGSGATRTVRHRPPFFEGATLGGLQRLRSVTSGRFNDKAVVYYSAELRLVPYWNPLRGRTLLTAFRLDWLQLVPFVEVGRVAPEWKPAMLHEDLYWDAGIDLRLWVSRTLVSVGAAVGDEDWAIKAGVGHPF